MEYTAMAKPARPTDTADEPLQVPTPLVIHDDPEPTEDEDGVRRLTPMRLPDVDDTVEEEAKEKTPVDFYRRRHPSFREEGTPPEDNTLPPKVGKAANTTK